MKITKNTPRELTVVVSDNVAEAIMTAVLVQTERVIAELRQARLRGLRGDRLVVEHNDLQAAYDAISGALHARALQDIVNAP